MRALISVSDKTGILEFAEGLLDIGFEIISTGGTYKILSEAGFDVTEVSEITGFAECLDGRVKTLHPIVHAGILAVRDNPKHINHINNLGIKPVDLVCVNLYPFKEALQRGAEMEETIENIDIGGPALIRSAAKNFQDVIITVDPADYAGILDALRGEIEVRFRLELMAKAFRHTAAYDALIAEHFTSQALQDKHDYPEKLTLTYEKINSLRYGENPHQHAAFYAEPTAINFGGLSDAVLLQGKELSFCNINDTHGALELLREFDYNTPTVVAVKHATPCGVAHGETLLEAYQRAYQSDPVSIFGGVLAINRELDGETAAKISEIFIEIIIAPKFSQEALEILCKKKNLRLLAFEDICKPQPATAVDIKKVSGGLLVQTVDCLLFNEVDLKCVTNRQPTEQEMKDLIFALKLVKHAKSNGIAIAKNGQSLGFGTGQTARIKSTNHAIQHAIQTFGEEKLQGAVMASDAFFPFDDCITYAQKVGISAIIQPGGSINDKFSIAACDIHNMAMLITGMRHFRH